MFSRSISPAVPSASTASSSPCKSLRARTRRRQLAALALAVAMAAPAGIVGFGGVAHAQDVPLVVSSAQAEQQSDNPIILAQQQEPLTPQQQLKQGQDQFKSRQFEDALSTLQAIDAEALNARDRRTLEDAVRKAEAAANQRRAARAEFEQGQAALNANKPGLAIRHFQDAADNKYADAGTQRKAREQIEVAESMRRGMAGEMKRMYSQAVAQYKRGNLAEARETFRQLIDNGYKAGAFQKSPQDYVRDINRRIGAAPAEATAEAAPQDVPTDAPAAPDATVAEAPAPAPAEAPAAPTEAPAAPVPPAEPVAVAPDTTAAPAAPDAPAPEAPAPDAAAPTEMTEAPAEEQTVSAPTVSARRAYLRGRDQYRKGNWIEARKNLELARQAGYRPGLFEDSPAEILRRMDRKEQADAARAARRAEMMARAEAARQPSAVAAPDAAPTEPVAPTEPAAPTAPEAVAQAPAEQPAAPAEPAAPTAPASPQQDLEATAQLDKIRAEQSAAEARQLVEQARAAQQAQRYDEALDKYSQAQRLDPNNEQAAAGAREMAALTGRAAGATNLLDQQAERDELSRQEIRFRIDNELRTVQEAIAANDFTSAQAALERARVAANQNPRVFSEAENRGFRTRIDQTQVAVNRAELDHRTLVATNEQTEIERRMRIQQEQEAAQRRRTVADLTRNANRLVNETRYAEALGVIDQILVLDPTNDYATGVRPLVEDKANFQEQRRYREDHNRQLVKQLNAAEEKKIPYDDILRYPTNWPDISELRDQTISGELSGTGVDAATQVLLDRPLPELKLEAIPFTDVVDALRDITGANIFVNWRALEQEGVDRAAPVTARLRNIKFSKALDTILADVGGGVVTLGYTIDEGVITISTETDLSRNTLTRVYDIRDLIIEIPDFNDAPQFQLQQQSAGRGGGGGGGSQGLFGQQGQGQEGETDREALITEIIELIQETVDPESWREAGGSVGSVRVLGGNLIVAQTPENHRALQGLLEQLRESQSIQITIETRFLTVQRNFLEDVGVDVDFVFNTDAEIDDRLGPIPVSNNTILFTANPQTGVPGSIGQISPGSQDPDDPNSTGVGALGLSGTYLDNFTVSFLVRATQAQQNSTVVTAPRVTLSNGQRGYLAVSTQTAYVSDLEPIVGTRAVAFDPQVDIIPSGILLDVTGTVSSDRKYVTLTLRPTLQRLAALQTFTVQSAAQIVGDDDTIPPNLNTGIATATLQQPILDTTVVRTTVTVPDGGTLLLGGQTLAGEIERESGVPVLSKIPFLKRLFTNRSTAKDEQVLLILIKPTIIIAKEQERKQFPLLSQRVAGQ